MPTPCVQAAAEGMPTPRVTAKQAASEKHFQKAFSGLESQIGRVVRLASLTGYLAELLEEERRKYPEMAASEALVDHLFFISSETQGAAQDLDSDWLAKFNAGPDVPEFVS